MATSSIEMQVPESGAGWIRFPDGTQICYGTIENITIAANSFETAAIQYPMGFNSSAKLVAMPVLWGDPRTLSVISKSIFQASGDIRIGNNANVPQTISVHWIAVGRWK